MSKNKEKPENSHFLLYQDDNGVTNVHVRFEDTDVWLAQPQIALLFDTTQKNVSQHINAIVEEGELSREATHKNFLLVRKEGRRSVQRQIEHYNLDMIIAVGYRVKSQVATRFRQWATQRLHEYIQKGFTLDDERLKGNGEIASRLDKMLSDFLADYNESLQRFQVMERLTKHENAYYRNLFKAKLLEIEKTPKEKRKDFKAKGELLDPDSWK